MIQHIQKDGKLSFRVQVVPRASRSEIVGEHDGLLRVRIAAPPVEGAANQELIRTIARYLGLKRSAVEISAGHASRIKQIRVTSSEAHDLVKLTKLLSLFSP